MIHATVAAAKAPPTETATALSPSTPILPIDVAAALERSGTNFPTRVETVGEIAVSLAPTIAEKIPPMSPAIVAAGFATCVPLASTVIPNQPRYLVAAQ